MSYNINLSDGTAVTIPANTVVDNQFSIPLVGRNWSGYGDEIATAFLHMLEHFSNDSAPSNPTSGQIWHDSSDNTVYFRNTANDAWLPLLAVVDNELEVCGDILPCDDLTYDIGSSSLRWNDVYGQYFYGTAQSAEYSDLAERYEADEEYPAGTVVKIGGEKEITQTTEFCDEDSFAVISSMPALMMNSKAGPNNTHPYVALMGRVPVRVKGKVKKGDRLVASDTAGVAVASKDAKIRPYAIGRALESKDSASEGMVMAFVKAIS